MTDAELDALIDQSQCITYYTSSDEAERLIKKLAVALAALREQIIELRENIKALDNSLSEANIKRGDAEADNAALREQVKGQAYEIERMADAEQKCLAECLTKNATLEADNAALRQGLQNIADADPSKWEKDVRDQFQQWVQSRVRTLLEAMRDLKADNVALHNAALRQWIDNNMTHYNTAEAGAKPILAEFGKRVWYHVTDDCESIPFSRVIDAAMREGKDKP